jgi:DNA-binding MarR family transcriptional regulator
MDSTTMTAAMKPLEKRGLVVLEVDDADARVRRPRLTQVAREVVAQAVPLWREEHARIQVELVGQDAAALARVLKDLG